MAKNDKRSNLKYKIMACTKVESRQWQDITYVRTLAKGLSLNIKQDVTIYKSYKRGIGDVFCFDIFKKGTEPSTMVEVIAYEVIEPIKPIMVTEIETEEIETSQLREPESASVLQDNGDEAVPFIAGTKTGVKRKK